jgi:hypothetical protein
MPAFENHPALKAIVKRRDRYCLSYPPEQWNTAFLLGFVESFEAVAEVVSPIRLTMPDAPMPNAQGMAGEAPRRNGSAPSGAPSPVGGADAP